MKVLVAEDDPVSAKILSASLARAGFECIVVEDGQGAWEVAGGADAPQIVLLDWMMPGLDGLEVCERIRALRRDGYTYIAILSSRCSGPDIAMAIAAGADDFICKPYRAEEVLARLRVATRLLGGRGPSALREVLRESLSAPGGDVYVRHGGSVGRIMVHEGKIAWAHISSEPGSLHALLTADTGISSEEIDAVLDECASSQRHFVDVIVDWGLMDAPALHARIQGWIRGKITTMSRWPTRSAFFAPTKRGGVDTLFEAADVCPEGLVDERPGVEIAERAGDDPARDGGELRRAILTGVDAEQTIERKLAAAMAIDGVFTAAIFDGSTGVCLGRRGEPLDDPEIWRFIKPALMRAGDDVEEMFVTTGTRRLLLSVASSAPLRLIFIGMHRHLGALGMARLSLAEIARAG